MDRKLAELKLGIERIWSADAPDYQEAARLVAAIASVSSEAMLRQAASQALPILRSASREDADQTTRDAARRRLGVFLEVLHALTTQPFGRRGVAPKLPTPEERYRHLLGLPLGRELSGAEIHRTRFSGVFGSWPASIVRSAMSSSGGPTLPCGPDTLPMV